MKLHIVMPMAGAGMRFRAAGVETPKPLIPVDGVPMFVRSLSGMPLEMAARVTFVVRREDVDSLKIDQVIQEHVHHPQLRVVSVKTMTSGQGASVLEALEPYDPGESLLIFNADSAFEDDIGPFLASIGEDVDGFLQTFQDSQPRWSFVRCDPEPWVVETAEKRVISNHASTGLYYFRRAEDFVEAMRLTPWAGGETYVAPLYNHLLGLGRKVLARPCAKFFCFGTPEDLDSYRQGHFYRGTAAAG
jgi:dTDP-glucose pyrophosphorylase